MSSGEQAPAINCHGLALPPNPVKVNARHRQHYGDLCRPNFHHLHFPRSIFVAAGPLAVEFREHELNISRIPKFQHDRLHRRYRTFIDKYPTHLLPPELTMIGFLDEALTVDLVRSGLNGIRSIDGAFLLGVIRDEAAALEQRAMHLDIVVTGMTQAKGFELLHNSVIVDLNRQAEAVLGTDALLSSPKDDIITSVPQ